MPGHFIPKKSGAHRIACIALYRALLSQCSRIQVPAESFRGSINPLKFQIRRQFQRNKNDTSSRLIVAALKIGYEAEELLRSAGDGNEASHSKVLSLLKDIHAEGDAARIRNAVNPPPKPPQRRIPRPYPGAPRLIDSRPRPKSELSGRRHVPILVNANAMPMLRTKKPQSPFLTRVLTDKVKSRQKRRDGQDKTELLMEWGRDEDAWDASLLGSRGRDGPSWTMESLKANKALKHANFEDSAKGMHLARSFFRIIDKEKELAEQERKERKMEKNKEREERRRREKKAEAGKSA